MQKWVGYCVLSRILWIHCNGSRYTESDWSYIFKDCHKGLLDYEYWEPYEGVLRRGLTKGSYEGVYWRGLTKGSYEGVYWRGLLKGSIEGFYWRVLWKGSIYCSQIFDTLSIFYSILLYDTYVEMSIIMSSEYFYGKGPLCLLLSRTLWRGLLKGLS